MPGCAVIEKSPAIGPGEARPSGTAGMAADAKNSRTTTAESKTLYVDLLDNIISTPQNIADTYSKDMKTIKIWIFKVIGIGTGTIGPFVNPHLRPGRRAKMPRFEGILPFFGQIYK
jgi:hypothetical protein